jgi:putative N6-adenine-specific DNA methylase
MSRFFVSCAVGFENDLLEELNAFWFEMLDLDGQPTRSVLEKYEINTGGIEIEVPDHLGFQINLFSKLANRVLLRIHRFESRYFDQFEKEFKKLDLSQYLDSQKIILKVETHKSRINNQKSIEESLTQLLKEKKMTVIATASEADLNELLLYVRIDKDRVTVSLDTSMNHLHKRGYAILRGEAPIRETYGAYLFKQVLKWASMKELSLIDPFVGSGTLLFEAQSVNVPNLTRNYKWTQFKNLPKLFKSQTWLKNYKWLQMQPLIQCFGIDIDSKSILNIQKNEILFNQLFPQCQSQIQVSVADSMNLELDEFKKMQNLWLITNPPYGHRLETGDAIQILEKFESELSLKGMAILHPEAWNFKFKKLKLVSKLDFKNQGLRLKLSVYSL